MKTTTLKQKRKLWSIFKDTPAQQTQAVLGSGLLPILRDADIAEVDREEFRKICGFFCEPIISIDRTAPFDSAAFIDDGWDIWEGDQDERSLVLTEVDLSKVSLLTCLKKNEKHITREVNLQRLKQKGCIRLDAKIFHTLWKDQRFIPKRWKAKTHGNTTRIFFDGSIIRSPRSGTRCVLSLHFDGQWHWELHKLDDNYRVGNLSAVLACK